jgi:hypothetical protein
LGFPNHYVGHYPVLAKWLEGLGHIVYPYEMFCNPVHVSAKKPSWNCCSGKNDRYESHSLYGMVDVVSWFGERLWAWEYKSQTDSLKRGFLQLSNYARSFDFVCLACVITPISPLYDKLRDLGAGIYPELPSIEDGFLPLDEPKLQKPNPVWREELVLRFRKNMLAKQLKREEFQQKHRLLTAFM